MVAGAAGEVTLSWPDRVPVVGVPVSVVSSAQVLAALEARPPDRATVVAFCNVHSVMTARRMPTVASAMQEADIVTPDGMPIVWGLRAVGTPQKERVDGPSFMLRALQSGVGRGWTHFFYGSTRDTLERLVGTVQRDIPDLRVAGSFSPPFRSPTPEDIEAAAAMIIESGAGLVWVGLGMPKQELWMQAIRSLVPGVALLGVGAAFDFIAGTSPRAPQWMQSAGLEWLHRLAQDPRRMWKRYLINNPLYLTLLLKDVMSRVLDRT